MTHRKLFNLLRRKFPCCEITISEDKFICPNDTLKTEFVLNLYCEVNFNHRFSARFKTHDDLVKCAQELVSSNEPLYTQDRKWFKLYYEL